MVTLAELAGAGDAHARRRAPLVTLAVLAALPYLPAIAAPFFADDYLLLEKTAAFASGSMTAALRSWVLEVADHGLWWTPPGLAVEYFRPLVSISLLLDRALFGMHAAGYHAVNLGLHIAPTLACYALAARLLSRDFRAWAAAAIFALHPCHAESVAWISGRTDLLATLFFGLAFLCHLRARPVGRTNAPLLGLGLVSFALALFAKEMAITLPAVLLLHNLLYSNGELLRRRLIAPGLAALVALAYLGLRILVFGGLGAPPHPFAHRPGDPDFLARVLPAPLLYFADLALCVPSDPVVTFPFWMRHPVWLALLGIVTVAALFDTARRGSDRRAVHFALGWMAVTLLPILSVSGGDHLLYLPSIGFALLCGATMPAIPGADPAAVRRLSFVLPLLFGVAVGRTILLDRLAAGMQRAIDDTLAALDHAPRATAVFIADLPDDSALFFPPAIRLARPGHAVDIEILSVTPHLARPAVTARSRILFAGDDLALGREAPPYLASAFEGFLRGARPLPLPGERVERPSCTITVLSSRAGGVDAIAVHPHTPGEALLLQSDAGAGDGYHLVTRGSSSR